MKVAIEQKVKHTNGTLDMKNIKIIIIVAWISCGAWKLPAQEYKVAKSSGRLEVNIGRVLIEGYNGSEIIFTSVDGPRDKDRRAEGLRAVNGSGLEDNTGLGINVTDANNIVSVRQLKKTNSPNIRIQVPKGVIVAYSYKSEFHGEVTLKNLENEIEISAEYNSFSLENITGPLTAKTIYGHIEATFGSNIKGPISIVSVYGYADVTLPASTKANLKLGTSYGEILVAPQFKIDVEPKADGMKHYSDNVNGKINGGGMNIDITCSYGKVYLRQK
jgi:Putative adhesin